MSDQTPAPSKKLPRSSRLSVRPDDGRPAEVRFMFETPEKRVGGAFGASLAVHGALIGFVLLLGWLAPDGVRDAILPVRLSQQIVFLGARARRGRGRGQQYA
jgi:hypothetical protein